MQGAQFLAGLFLLAVGAEGVVRGGSRLAVLWRVSPLVIGLTIVAFGTSAPELAVSVSAAIHHDGELALSNVIGSNIFNVLVILGFAALITPLTVQAAVIQREVPIMLGVSVLVTALAWTFGRLGRAEGALCIVLLALYVIFSYWMARREPEGINEEYASFLRRTERPSLATNALFVVGGLALLAVGGSVLVDSAVFMARAWGLSERVIGLTLIAAGTSVPEAATAIAAALRKEIDIAVGNVIGSNIFNLLGIAGTAALISPIDAHPALLRVDLPIMLAVSFAAVPIMLSHHRISRTEGGALAAAYGVYLAFMLAAR
ncbi:MAG: calcium/sodium antiporter [Candidatus Hydrogenedentota bacterium]